VYAVDVDGDGESEATPVYCDMTSDTGGWTLIMKTTADGDFGFDSPFWTTTPTRNPRSLNLSAASAKLEAFNQVPFTSIRGCVGTPRSNCVQHSFQEPLVSALSLFSGPYRAEGVVRAEFDAVFMPEGLRDCPPQRPGFNAFNAFRLNNEGNAARWGYFASRSEEECQSEPEDDSDWSIGWGLQLDRKGPIGAGLHTSGQPTHGPRESWLWVR
jgi:hypothetical protein